MDAVALLQLVGFNKYEAEAYIALAAQGPLTGYEVGKRSQVPLSRSYEILERLVEKGWAQVQSGEPPHYLATAPQEMVARLRATLEMQLSDLTTALTELATRPLPAGYWVLRGRAAILARIRSLIAEATTSVELDLPTRVLTELDDTLGEARQRLRLSYARTPGTIPNAAIVRVDERVTLVGSLAPDASCQVIVSTDPALVAVIHAHFTPQRLVVVPTTATAGNTSPTNTDWLSWEARKQRQLRVHRTV